MIKKLAILSVALFVSSAIYAQPGKKITKSIKAATSFKQSAAYQAALRHAQAIQSSTAAKLPAQPLEQTVLTAATVPVRHARKSPKEHLNILKNFIKEHGYFPRYSQPQEKILYNNLQNTMRKLGPQHPITLRIRKLQLQYSKNKKTPQIRLDELENFIARHRHFPRPHRAEEKNLYQYTYKTIKQLGPQHPITLRIQELQAQTRKYPRHTTFGWLYELEDFMAANDRYPALGNTLEENQLYFEIDKLINTLDIDDPVSVRIKEIRAQYLQTQETKQ